MNNDTLEQQTRYQVITDQCDCSACNTQDNDAYWGDNYHADLARALQQSKQ